MKIDPEGRLLPGTVFSGGWLHMPPEGGGFLLPEIAREKGRWLNMVLTLGCSHAQAFELRLYGEEKAPRVIIRFGLMPLFRAQIALDLNWADGHILFPGHRPGCQKVVCHGSRIAREEIRRAEFVSMPCFEGVKVCCGEIALEDAPRPALPPTGERMIDEFGQYVPKDWPGRIRSGEELRDALRTELSKGDARPGEGWTPWGGRADRPLAEGTGFFTRVKKDGRWYLADPSGCAFFSMGPDCVVARCDARIDGLEGLLSPLPPRDGEGRGFYEDMEKPFGETERPGGLLFSYERWNLKRAFGDGWEEKWRCMVTGQLKRMGMNTLGNWSDPALYPRMPYVTMLPEFPGTRHRIFRDFPDVLSREYEEEAARCARALAQRREDPLMIGYFLRNEPAWAFVDGLIIADEVLRDPCDTASKEGLIAFLRGKYPTPEALSRAWGYSLADFDSLRRPIEKASALSDAARADLRAYSAYLTEAYMRIPAEACRRQDANHLILGMRWAWISDPLLVSGWENFDVFSINCYAQDPTPALERVRGLGVDLPVMIGEFHFGALDAGLPATGLEAVGDQRARGDAYRYYCERAAAHPLGVGCHWFQCYDQFALGRFDGENYNIGLFDITLRPYPDMAEAVRAAALAVDGVKAGERAPFDRRPDALPMIAY